MRLLLIALLSGVLLSACGEDDDTSSSSGVASTSSSSTSSSSSSGSIYVPPPPVELPGDAVEGKLLYDQQCKVCHGENGEGSTQLNSPSLIGCSVCDQPTQLVNYITTDMPPGNSAQQCTGDCSENIAAYLLAEFNSGPDLSDCSDATPSPSVFKRLSREEYRYTLMDLLQLNEAPDVDIIPNDPSIHNFQTIASIQGVQVNHLNAYVELATQHSEELMDSSSRREQVLGCNYQDSGCLRAFVTNFGRLAYRRPLEATEIERIVSYAQSNGESDKDRFILALQVMLTSPNYIFRVEVGNQPEGLATLNDYELASRLAFSLWGRGPDNWLLDEAEAGELSSEQGLREIARDMLKNSKAKQNMTLFIEQWLATNLIKAPSERPQNWYTGILDDMRSETDKLMGEYIWGDKDFMGVFTESRSYMTPELSKYYGFDTDTSDDSAQSLPADSPRSGTGILTHGANMVGKTDGDLVAKRGNWLRNTFLCKNLELPANITEIINGKFSGFTPMEIINARNTDSSCNRCHAQIDPIGIAFAPYQRNGLYDHSVNISDFPLEPGFPDSGDPTIKTVKDIAKALSEMPEVSDCLAERLFLYTRNHEPKDADHCTVNDASHAFKSEGNKFASILLSLVESPTFRQRVAPEVADDGAVIEPEIENLALNRPVSTSSAENGNPGIRITDNNINGDSRWSAQVFPQTATIDLRSIFTIVQAEVFPYEDRAYHYIIEASETGANYVRVVDRSNNNEGGNVISDLFSPTKARYVRITITGASGYDGNWASLRELKIYGSPN